MSRRGEDWARGVGLLREFWRRGGHARPERITAILTEQCHLRCDFCRLWESPAAGVPLDQWREVFRRNPFLRWVNLSGGELFARQGLGRFLEDVVAALPRLALLDFPTAGQRPAEAADAVDRLLATRLPRLVVTVSLDGDADFHDRLRGVEGAFDRAVETLRLLRPRRSRRFQVAVGCTLTRQARVQVDGLTHALRALLPGFHEDELHFNLAHHSSHYYRNQAFQDLPEQEALELLEQRPPVAGLMGWAEWVYARAARRSLREGFPAVGCEALAHTVFVGPDLTVHPCSIWDHPVGNLRETDLRLEPLLQGIRAREARQRIERRDCPGCWTPCEAAPAMLAHPLRATWAALWNGGP